MDKELRIVSRDMAEKLGLTRYYTGVPCKRGHKAERFVSSGGCVDCQVRKQPKLVRGAGTLVVAAEIKDGGYTLEDIAQARNILISWIPSALQAAQQQRKQQERAQIEFEIALYEKRLSPDQDPDDVPTGAALEGFQARLRELRAKLAECDAVHSVAKEVAAY